MTSTASPRLQDSIRAWARAETAEVITCRSAEVASVDDDGSVTVRMLTPVQEVVAGEARWVEAPLLPRIPVGYVALGDLKITSTPKIGNRGLVVIRDVSHDEVDSGQGAEPVVTPQDPRRWDTVDAVFLPFQLTDALWSTSNTPASGGAVVLEAGTVLRVGSASAASAVALAQETASRIERIEAYLNTATFAVSGAVTTAPSPPPFIGTTSLSPTSNASVVLNAVASTTTAYVASSRLVTDD